MKEYIGAVAEVIARGTRRENRTGVDTIAAFNVNYQIDLRDGFPLLTTKRVNWKNVVIETLWFLSGSSNVALLHRHGCRFWDPWTDQDGMVPSAYGQYWRQFPSCSADGRPTTTDQIQWVLRQMQSEPMSRRHVVTAWAPENAHTSPLPPCHCMFVLSVQNAPTGRVLHLHLTQRSADMALGVPYNIAGYALLLALLARLAGLEAGIFAHTLVDAHIYTSKPDGAMADHDHLPGLQVQIARKPKALPTLSLDPSIRTLSDVVDLTEQPTTDILHMIAVEGYEPHPPISFKVAI